MKSAILKYAVLATVLLAPSVVIAADAPKHAEPAATHEAPLNIEPVEGDAHHGSDEGNVPVIDVAHPDAAHGGEHHAVGLPQMDTKWFPSQIFWLAVTGVFLYVVFSKKVLPQISSTLESRRNQIQEDLDFAQSLKLEAEKTHQAYEQILSEARNNASAKFVTLDEEMKKKISQKNEQMNTFAQSKIRETESVIESAKQSAMSEMQGIAAEVASAAASKIIGVTTDIDQAKTLIKNIGKKAA